MQGTDRTLVNPPTTLKEWEATHHPAEEIVPGREKPKAYVSAPMRGRPSFNFYVISAIADRCRHIDQWHVFSPAENDLLAWPELIEAEGFFEGDIDLVMSQAPEGYTLEALLALDLKQVSEADHLVLAPGWEDSSGCRIERFVAEQTGSRIWLANDDHNGSYYLTLDAQQRRMGEAYLAQLTDDAVAMQPTPVSLHHRAADYTPIQAYASADAEITGTPGSGFVTKDSGVREEYASGMVRDTNVGKPRYDLIPVGPLRRLAELYERGARKYGECNWQLADSADEHRRFRASALRHAQQWLAGDEDEDHAIAVVWNIFAFLWLEEKIGKLPEYGEKPIIGEVSADIERLLAEEEALEREAGGWFPFYKGEHVTLKHNLNNHSLRGTVIKPGIDRCLVQWDDTGEQSEACSDLRRVGV